MLNNILYLTLNLRAFSWELLVSVSSSPQPQLASEGYLLKSQNAPAPLTIGKYHISAIHYDRNLNIEDQLIHHSHHDEHQHGQNKDIIIINMDINMYNVSYLSY